MMIELRHGNPPDFYAKPLMTEVEIANELGYRGNVNKYLVKYYAANGIERSTNRTKSILM